MNLRILIAGALLTLPALVSAAEEAARAAAPVTDNEPTVNLVELIGKVAKQTGKQFVLDPRISGRVPATGIDINRTDYATLLAILRVNSMVTFTQGGIVNVIPDAGARQVPVPVIAAGDTRVADDELVTSVMQVTNICVAHAVPILRPMMPQYAHLAAYPATGTMLIVDRAANVRRITDLLARLDKQAASNKQSCDDIK
jgi:general secretion pathway protein D